MYLLFIKMLSEDWSLYTASPLRAFEGELGVQAGGDI